MYRWTFIHLKAPTQVTCAHCQRSWTCGALFASRPKTFRRREPGTIQPISCSSTPRSKLFCSATPGRSLWCRPSVVGQRGVSSKGRASYIGSAIRQHPSAKFFCDRTSRAAERRRCSAMQLARNRCARLAVARGAGLRAPRRGARARTTACPPAATVRRPPRRSARDRRPRRHRCAVRARRACA